METLLENPLTRNWLVCTEAHIYTANVVRKYVTDTFENFYKNEGHLSTRCPCNKEHKGSCDSHDNEATHCVHYNRRSRTWWLVTEPRCGHCVTAFETIIPMFKDIHSSVICWDNIKFWKAFQGSWNIAKLFMPPGNCNTDDPSVTDVRVLHNIMYTCHLFEVNTDILNELIQNRIRLLQNKEMAFSNCDTDKLFTLIIKFIKGLPLGEQQKNTYIRRIRQIKGQAANVCMFEAALADKIHFLLSNARDSPIESNDIFKQIEIVLRLKIEDIIRVEAISRNQHKENERITKLSNERNDYADRLNTKINEISQLRKKDQELRILLENEKETSNTKKNEISQLRKKDQELRTLLENETATSNTKKNEISQLRKKDQELRMLLENEKMTSYIWKNFFCGMCVTGFVAGLYLTIKHDCEMKSLVAYVNRFFILRQ